MKAIIFGGTGMIGQGVLLECLDDPEITEILVVGRRPLEKKHPKVKDLIHKDFSDFSGLEDEVKGYDACFWCLGTSSAGKNEAEYTRITYDFTLTAARFLADINPEMTFCYVSGAGTDSSEKGRSMWARVKGKTENDLMKLPFKAVYNFRPGYIQPKKGIRSSTWWYQAMYDVFGLFYPLWKLLFKKYVTTSEILGRAMINTALKGYKKNILESDDINIIGETKA